MNVNLRRGYKKIGNLQVHHADLYEGKLKVLYISSFPCPKLKTQRITEDLQTLIIDLVETEGNNEINRTIVGRLSDKEREIFNNFLKCSGMITNIKYKIKPRTIQERFQILQGSIIAGNDNKESIAECIDLINILTVAGKIDQQDATEILDEFKRLNN